jgi:hypothetical protein
MGTNKLLCIMCENWFMNHHTAYEEGCSKDHWCFDQSYIVSMDELSEYRYVLKQAEMCPDFILSEDMM